MNVFNIGFKRVPINQAEILYAGTARNVAKFIEKEVQLIESCFGEFKRVYGLIVESDSTDETIEVLEKIRSNSNYVRYISYKNLAKKMPKRTERLAYCRNQIVKELRENQEYANVDYVAILDLDGVNSDLTAEKIAQCWSVKENWSVITANQGDCYYDIWALRHPDWCPSDCMQQINRLQKFCDEKAAHNLAVWARNIHIDSKVGLIPVESAFGGFGIYKREAFLTGRYEGLNADGDQVCEHVNFHKMLINAGHMIYINSALINCGKPAQVEPVSLGPKKHTVFIFSFIQALGNAIFGKKRFNKYLDLMRNLEV